MGFNRTSPLNSISTWQVWPDEGPGKFQYLDMESSTWQISVPVRPESNSERSGVGGKCTMATA
ncbi:hypothetical protein BAUCODRAFT_29249 [Baudoinia panamericana UAMH 10762]|uniref:Uncharacterized protein n=1 Tax=Baudoinia panamericana (strain UAMH 10762) TaxID=717646 RepID=M2MV84_BAUPA|nr:uncharacterized protein BAUCODRAFT_29249 [Baudoinia panamericana UAMH 10762]EMD00867.1 hypothetical protein BAUCODRAFT_29249 [Baudoinia panamericana UAMH 10762]